MINAEVNRQLNIYGKVLREEVLPALDKEGIVIYDSPGLCDQHIQEVERYFRTKVMSYLHLILRAFEWGSISQ